ncbi:MAG TPA: DUF3857 domain-containing protein, partial [Verrucomicrobiae bacterium]|nr:DUF3857 domain-containing protein [Verrucomicrobiae bacterium]
MTTSRRATILMLALAGSLAGAGLAEAARLPDWAKEIADAAPPVPEGVAPYPARVLLSEMRYRIRPDGRMDVRRRFATQALSSRAESVGTGYFVFYDTMKVTASRAWHIPPGEKASRSWGPPAEVTLDQSFLNDTKARVVQVKDVKKGSLVFYEFEAEDTPRWLPISAYFYDGAPASVHRLEVETPPGWKVDWAWLRQKGPEPAVAGDVRTWTMTELPVLETEALGSDPEDRAPLLVVNPVPPPGVKTAPAAFSSWGDFSRWQDEVMRGRDDVTPRIADAAKSAVAGAGTDFYAKVKAAATFVRDRVRYVDIELGIGGIQPRPAADTLTNLYGDCKDKGTLFRSLLHAADVASYAVLVSLGSPDTLSAEVPAWGFDHFIVAVPVPDGEEIPVSFAPSVVDAGDLGKMLIVDTTDEKTAIGSLSASLGGKRGLLVAGDRGRLIQLPSGDPAVHTLVRRLKVEMLPNRSLAVVRESRYRGTFAWSARSRYSSSSVERRKGVEQRILQIWPDATVKDFRTDYETADGEFVETLDIQLRPVPSSGTAAKIDLFPGAADDVERVPLGKRKSPVDYGHAQTVRYEVTLTGIPETAALPAAQASAGEGWKVTTTYARERGTIVATWEVVLSRTRFDPEAFAELRKFWSAMASASS